MIQTQEIMKAIRDHSDTSNEIINNTIEGIHVVSATFKDALDNNIKSLSDHIQTKSVNLRQSTKQV